MLHLDQDIVSFFGIKGQIDRKPSWFSVMLSLYHGSRSELINGIWNKLRMFALQILSYRSI